MELDEHDNPIEKIVMPGSPEYRSSFEKIFGKPGVPEGFELPLDLLGRKRKDEDMSMKTGSLSGIEDKPELKVLVYKDHMLEFPDLFLKVCVLGPPEDTKGFARLFGRASCKIANNIDDADLVVFTGGPDVDPAYYSEPKLSGYHWGDEDRDSDDIAAYYHCYNEGIPMTGICRGAQFLAVMNGAKLFPHIEDHQSPHDLWDPIHKHKLLRVSSVHHQAVRPGADGMEVWAYDSRPVLKWKANKEGEGIDCGKSTTVEAFLFRDTCCFGVQGHPEYSGFSAFSQWYLQCLDEIINTNPDLVLVKDRRRLKPELIEERNSGLKITTSKALVPVQDKGNK